MSKLENFAGPAVMPLIVRRSRCVLSLDDQAAIVSWCMKMGMVFEHTAPAGAERFYARAEHLSFRITLTPPDGVYIWLAHYRGRRRAHSTVQNLTVAPRKGGQSRHLQAITIVINHFAFQVVAGRWHEGTRIDLDSADRHRWNGVTLRVWPNDDRPLNWPPPMHLTDQTLQAFTDRWSTGISFRRL